MGIMVQAIILCFNKSSKGNCTISTGVSNLGVWCKKWSYWTFRVGQKIRHRQKPPAPCDFDTGSASLVESLWLFIFQHFDRCPSLQKIHIVLQAEQFI